MKIDTTSQLELRLSEDAQLVSFLKHGNLLFTADLNAVHRLIEALQKVEHAMVERVADDA